MQKSNSTEGNQAFDTFIPLGNKALVLKTTSSVKSGIFMPDQDTSGGLVRVKLISVSDGPSDDPIAHIRKEIKAGDFLYVFNHSLTQVLDNGLYVVDIESIACKTLLV